MKRALVIHPRFYVYGGGELLCLYVCKTLQEEGYEVELACDVFDPAAIMNIYGFKMAEVMSRCKHIPIPTFKPFLPKLLVYQRLMYAKGIEKMILSHSNSADVIISTQSSMFSTAKPMSHFVYDMVDLFAYPAPLASLDKMSKGGKMAAWRKIYYATFRLIRTKRKTAHFFALSNNVLRDLKVAGFHDSSLIYPPCESPFKPKPKSNMVVQVTRIVPQKRLEMFIEAARRMPEYDFYIVGRDNPILQRFNPGYSKKLFHDSPENLIRIEGAIRNTPWVVEDAKVYLYTGIEPGIGIALVEAIRAGCIPISPDIGGGSEVVDAVSPHGYKFRSDSVDDMVVKIRLAMEDPSSPESVSQSARIFAPEAFQDTIRKSFQVLNPS